MCTSGDWPSCGKGVLKVAVWLAYTTSHSASVVAATPIAGPLTAATSTFGKPMNASMNWGKEEGRVDVSVRGY